MKISLVISTYNWETALKLCLNSVLKQTVMPDEVLITDDGSKNTTRELIEEMSKKFSCPVKHVWHEDKGFRRTIIHNQTIIEAEGDYIIFVDGDIILHPKFIEDHTHAAKKHYFSIGSRTKLTAELSQKILESGNTEIHFWQKGVKRKLNAIRLSFLAPFLLNYKQKDTLYGRGCNIAVWKEDLLAVNGFDESYQGWGQEDTDLICRLINKGLHKQFLKLQAVQYHIYHKSSTTEGASNKALLQQCIAEKRSYCTQGISLHVNSIMLCPEFTLKNTVMNEITVKVNMTTDDCRIAFTFTSPSITPPTELEINWGDGQTTDLYEHCYAQEGKYTITIKGKGIVYFDCSKNQLTSLDVTKCTALERLNCGWNKLTSLDVSGCTALKELGCHGNQLTSLDVSKCTALEWLHYYDNQSNAVSLNKIFTDLPMGKVWIDEEGDEKQSRLECNYNPGSGKCDISIAEKKGWDVGY